MSTDLNHEKKEHTDLLTVLVVDDSETARNRLAQEIGDGFRVLQAQDGLECLDILTRENVDLVTMDIEMPGLNGFEVCHKIRTYSETPTCKLSSIPIIFVATQDNLSLRMRGYDSGGSNFINKGFEDGALLEQISLILKPQSMFAGMNVLLVDDDLITQRLVESSLRPFGVDIAVASNALEGLASAEAGKESLDLVITDCNMPLMTGIEMCDRIRTQIGLTNIPIMFLCGEKDQEEVVNIFNSGATSFHRKPFIKEDLLANVESHLKNRLSEKRLRDQNSELKSSNEKGSATYHLLTKALHSPLSEAMTLAQSALDSDSDEDLRTDLEMVKLYLEHLSGFLNDNLTKPQSPARKIESTEMVDIQMLLNETVRHVNEHSRTSPPIIENISLPEEFPRFAACSRADLSSLLWNFMMNAVNFTPEGGRLELHGLVQPAPDTEKVELHLSFVPTSDPIPTEPGGQAFNPLAMSSEEIDTVENPCLNLILSSSLLDAIGGKIWADNSTSLGSAFYLSIPLLESNSHSRKITSSSPATSASSSKRPFRVLVAEDNKLNQKLLSTILKQQGYDVHCVDDGLKAVNRFKQETFDLVLMDIKMPHMDGVEAVKMIREHEKTSGTYTPVVAVTAYAQESDELRFLKAGMDGYIAKPFSKTALLDLIETFKSEFDLLLKRN